MMVKAIKHGAHTSAHTLSRFLLYFILCTTLLFSNVFFLCFNSPSCSWLQRSFKFNHQYVFGSGILLWTPCCYTQYLKCSVYVFYFADQGCLDFYILLSLFQLLGMLIRYS